MLGVGLRRGVEVRARWLRDGNVKVGVGVSGKVKGKSKELSEVLGVRCDIGRGESDMLGR